MNTLRLFQQSTPLNYSLSVSSTSLKQLFKLFVLFPSIQLDEIVESIFMPFGSKDTIHSRLIHVVSPNSIVDPSLIASIEFFSFCLHNLNDSRCKITSFLILSNEESQKEFLRLLSTCTIEELGDFFF